MQEGIAHEQASNDAVVHRRVGVVVGGCSNRVGLGSQRGWRQLAPAGAAFPYGVMAIAGLVMLVMWIGALVKLAALHASGWFVGVPVLHLVALGIIGMMAYAIWGPDHTPDIATRPSAT